METIFAPLALFLIFAVSVYYVFSPFLAKTFSYVDLDMSAASTALQLRKMSLYKQIREAEFEKEMGLLDPGDYERIKDDLFAETATVLSEIQGDGSDTDTLESSSPGCPSCNEPIVSDTKFCSNCGTELAENCPQCEYPNAPGDRFCTSCGRGLLD